MRNVLPGVTAIVVRNQPVEPWLHPGNAVSIAKGVGHSMGAHALVQAAAFAPQRFRQLVLIDPVIRAPAEYHQPAPPADALHPAAQRRNRFASAQEMFDRFVDRPPYSVFDTQALHDYCQHGLKPAADGQGYVTYSNVNAVEEMVNMLSASRSYQNNVEVMNTAKSLLLKTLQMGQ